jgi:hypothetical protein
MLAEALAQSSAIYVKSSVASLFFVNLLSVLVHFFNSLWVGNAGNSQGVSRGIIDSMPTLASATIALLSYWHWVLSKFLAFYLRVRNQPTLSLKYEQVAHQ